MAKMWRLIAKYGNGVSVRSSLTAIWTFMMKPNIHLPLTVLSNVPTKILCKQTFHNKWWMIIFMKFHDYSVRKLNYHKICARWGTCILFHVITTIHDHIAQLYLRNSNEIFLIIIHIIWTWHQVTFIFFLHLRNV